MSKVILKIENVSKQYRLGQVGTGTISHDLNRWWAKIRGKEDPFLKIGETNDRSKKGDSDYVWALQNINFEVNQGEVLGIIGKNGAGKSTLLKILSRVTSPTTGSIKTRGRIASLLEVGTGFHPEMTGRENVYLNGAILGMTKKEIASKIDEIIEFSGCERYIDTPVKRYSSGMTVRLAFAVAAHLDPEILVIDEVLAVGDAEFQKKAIGKMQDISREAGKTVLFVSHNMAAVKSLCSRGVLLNNGLIDCIANIDIVLERYLKISKKNVENKVNNENFTVSIKHNKVVEFEEDINFEICLEAIKTFDQILFLDFAITNQLEEIIIHYRMNVTSQDIKIERGINLYNFTIEKPRLKPGEYSFVIYIYDKLNNVYCWLENYSELQVLNDKMPLEAISSYKSQMLPKVIFKN